MLTFIDGSNLKVGPLSQGSTVVIFFFYHCGYFFSIISLGAEFQIEWSVT